MEKGEGVRRMIVAETALSRAIGANMTSIDRQGRRSIAIRNPSTKRAGDHGESFDYFFFLCKKGLFIQLYSRIVTIVTARRKQPVCPHNLITLKYKSPCR